MRQPTEQVVQVVSTCSRSHGRDLKRYGAAVSAPTGQIWIVLPAKYESKGSPGKMATSVRSPRSAKSMKGSPATSSAKRVQRRALDAALPVEQHERADLDGLGPVPLLLYETALSRPVRHHLVLEGALTSFVADGTVEGVVEEQELEHALLGLAGGLGLGEDLLALGHLDEARRLQARAPGTGDLDKAHPAHAHRLHPRVIAKARDEDPGPLGSRDDELALLGPNGPPVDGDGDARRGFDEVSHGAPHRPGMGNRPL